jgi:hypothetical protein
MPNSTPAAAAPNVVQATGQGRYPHPRPQPEELNAAVARVRRSPRRGADDRDAVETAYLGRVEPARQHAAGAAMGRTERSARRPSTPRTAHRRDSGDLTEEDIAPPPPGGLPQRTPCRDFVVPYGTKGGGMVGSTDVGDVSWKVPTVQARGATWAIGTPAHSWQAVAQGKSPLAHTGMVHVAKVMAGTALDALRDPALIARAKADHATRTGGRPYESPLPPMRSPHSACRWPNSPAANALSRTCGRGSGEGLVLTASPRPRHRPVRAPAQDDHPERLVLRDVRAARRADQAAVLHHADRSARSKTSWMSWLMRKMPIPCALSCFTSSPTCAVSAGPSAPSARP